MEAITSEELANQAERLRQAGDEAEAKKLAEQALGLNDATTPMGWHVALRCLGTMAWSNGDLKLAGKYYARALGHRRNSNSPSAIGTVAALDDLALVQYFSGARLTAFELRLEALELAKSERIPDPKLLRRLKRRLAQSYQSLGFIDDAETLYQESRPQSDDSVEDRIGWLNAMALVAEDKGEIANSAKWFDEVIDLLDSVEHAEGMAAALGNAIETRIELGHYREAAVQMRRLCRLCKADRKLASQLALHDVRIAMLAGRRRYQAALRTALSAEQLVRNAVSTGQVPVKRIALRAMLLRLAERLQEATELISAHLPIKGEWQQSHVPLLIELAQIRLLEAQACDSRDLLTQSLVLDAGSSNQDRRWLLLSLLAETADAIDRPRAAILLGKMALAHVRGAVRNLHGGELESWLRPRMATYDRILNRLTASGREPEAARLQLRRNREMSLRVGPVLRGGTDIDRVPFRPGEAALWERYLQLNEAMRPKADETRRGTPSESAKQLMDLLDEILDERYVDDASLPSIPRNFQQVNAFPQLAFLPFERGLRCLFNDRDGETAFSIDRPLPDLAAEVRALRQAMLNGSDDWQQISRTLHDSLLGPISDQLASAQRVEIVASGLVGFIPFAALFDGKHFLAEKTALCFRTGQRERRPNSENNGRWSVAAFATAAGTDLTNAVIEARDLTARSKGRDFLEERFTLPVLKKVVSRGVNLLHIATHFAYEPSHPHRSRLLLGDGRWISLSELASSGLDLSGIDLLVLSGCETGISDSLDLGIEGLAGHMQAFGAQTVIATLWRVGDTGSRELMSAYYDVLFSRPDMDPVAALGVAQAKMVNNQDRAAELLSAGRGIGGGRRPAPVPDWAGFAAFVP